MWFVLDGFSRAVVRMPLSLAMDDDFLDATDPNDNPSNKRMHVYFLHSGLMMFSLIHSKQCIEKVVARVWSQFGRVTNTYYHREMSYGFISFSSHEEAAAAIEAFRDYSRHKEIVAAAVATLPEASAEAATSKRQLTRANAQQIADMVFTKRHGQSEALLWASWASPRR